MNFSNTHRKVVAFILTLALIITGVFPTVVFPTGVAFGAESDISDHWAQTAIQEALANGYISGYPDGSFRPDDPVTRAEFVTMVNGALGLKEENKVNLLFTDVDKSVWYYDEVQKASYAQYISGTSDTTFAPEALITRQEAAAMLSRFLPGMEETNLSILSSFSDSVKLSNWAITPMAFMIEKGYKTGYQDKTLRPLGSLTRAEAVQIINQILHKETIVREDTSVKEAGAILANAIYVGDITIESSVGSGDVGFADLSALSKVYVYGGGSNTVTIDNSLIIEMIVGKIGSAVRVLVNDDSDIKRSLVLGSNLLVNERGEVAEPRTGPYGEIVTIKGTTSQRTFLQYVDSLGERLTQSGKLDLAQIHSVIGEINSKASGTQHKLGEFFIIIPQPRVTASSPSEDPVDPSPYGTVPLEAIAFCGTSHGGIGAFTTIASITINGETTTAYAIYTPAQLQHLALHQDANAILMADLDFSGVTTGAVGATDPNTPMGALSAAAIAVGGSTLTELRITNFTGGNFTPIGTSSKPYTGTLYGNEKVITGLTISGSAVDYVGIFGYASGAAIKDLTTSGGSVSGKAYVGGIVGYSTNSTVSTVYNTGNVSGTNEFIGGIAGKSERSTVSSSHNTGTVTGRQVGGVVGWNSKSSMVSNSYNTGNVILSAGSVAGGIVGNNNENCTVSGVYNTGSVSGTYNIGGIVGYNYYNSTVTNSYNTGSVSGTGSFVGGVVGKNDSNNGEHRYSAVSDSYNMGTVVSTGSHVGGVVGYNDYGTSVSGSYNTGAVFGNENVGGIAGTNNSTSTISSSYNMGAVSGSGHDFGGVVGENAGTVSGSWLEGTNLTSPALGIGAGTGTATTFSGITGDGITLSTIYTSMGAIATSAGGAMTGAISAIAFSGVDTPMQFNVLQGAYITSLGSLTVTVGSVSGTTVTVVTGSSINNTLLGTGEVVSDSKTINGLASGTWILIRAVNTDAKLNRNYFVYVK